MLGYRRRYFMQAVALQHALSAKPDDLTTLLQLERILLREIVFAEDHIRRLKRETAENRRALRTTRPQKDEALKLKRRDASLKARIEGYRQLAYIWRCFGDGIAFTYLDRFAIKHAYYSTRTVLPKQDAGFISGKNGLVAEIAVVEDAAASGVPSILSDLTNVIRHGDVCLLGESDPVFLEVKAGDKLGERGRRQIEDIKTLHGFYETDSAEGLRGFPQLRRRSVSTGPVDHTDAMNRCIRAAAQAGVSIVHPEEGLYYVAIRDQRSALADVFQQMQLSRPMVFTLNSVKSDRSWAPYMPFTLTIADAEHLYDFIRGELYLMVIVDIDVLCKAMARPGFGVSWHDGLVDYPLRLTGAPDSEQYWQVSQHLLNRIGFEFLSPRWIAQSQQRMIDEVYHSFDHAAANAQDDKDGDVTVSLTPRTTSRD